MIKTMNQKSLIKSFGDKLSDAQLITLLTFLITVIGHCVCIFYAKEYLHTFWGVGNMWALACQAVGSTAGFIFGIPKTMWQTIDNKIAKSNNVNTNLEKISDWLTNIIVGIGLIELKQIPHLVKQIAEYISKGFPSSVDSVSFCTAIVIYFSMFGFAMSYLLTRIYVAPAFKRADKEANAETIINE